MFYYECINLKLILNFTMNLSREGRTWKELINPSISRCIEELNGNKYKFFGDITDKQSEIFDQFSLTR